MIGRLVHADSWIALYEAECPECGYGMEWAVRTPPIPLTLFQWFNNAGDEPVCECPRCGADLPEGDLLKVAA